MKILRLLLLLPFLMAFQCDEDNEFIDDPLNDTGLIGRWEIADEVVNDTTDALPKSGRFFEFDLDDNPDDLKGRFFYEDDTGVSLGTFTVDAANQTILIQRDESAPITHTYSLDDNQEYLYLTFMENDVRWEQTWIRRY